MDLNPLEPLLAPQERLDRLIAATFRRFGPRTVDLSYANPHDGPDEAVRDALARAVAEASGLELQYGPYGGRTTTRRLVASSLRREYGLPFDFRDVIMTSGAMAALNVVFRALFQAGDEVVLLTPCWQDYPLYLRHLNLSVRCVALGEDKHFELEAIRRALGPRTKGVLFSQPSCPTGVVYSKDEIDGLAEVLREAEERFRTAIHVISDEVHRKMVWGRDACHSPLLSHPRSLSIYSFGKALSLQGQRIGYIAVSPRMPEREEVRQALERCVRIMGYGSPSSLMQRAVCDLVDYTPPVGALARKQRTVRSALAAYGYEVCPAEATFFVYAKCPVADDFGFAELLASRGVLIVPSTLFHEAGYIRLSLTDRSGSIEAGLPAFAQVVKGSEERPA